jgi:alcohol dehydrogenase YqhD (iron-dependent ADH family)
MRTRIPERIEKLGEHLFGIKDIDKTILQIETFFSRLGSPVSLSEINIDAGQKSEILKQMNKNKASGMAHLLDDNDREKILSLMF